MRPPSAKRHSGNKISELHLYQVRNNINGAHHLAFLKIGSTYLKCAIGHTGRKALKREGDGASPLGRFQLVTLFYRPDRQRRPTCLTSTKALRPDFGWCDHVGHGQYNRFIVKPFAARHEDLWRIDHVYDLVFTINHNSRPRINGAGSAIFMHLAHTDYQPTAGCVALPLEDLRRLLPRLAARVWLTIH